MQEALRKAGVAGKLTLAPNIKALGDALGVQGIVLTGIMPPEGGTQGAMVLQVYDTFTGLKEGAIVAPAAAGGLRPDTVTKFAQDNSCGWPVTSSKLPGSAGWSLSRKGKFT